MALMTVAATILEQLGGHRFSVMTGAKDFMGSADSLTFRLPANTAKDRINKVRITLTQSDLYTVECFNIRGATVKAIRLSENVYADQLQAAFTRMTRLDTHL